jgi:DNA topoisomerase-1
MREIAIPVISELEIRRETDPGGEGHVYRLLLGDSRGPSPKSKRPLPTADSPNKASADAPDERALGRDPETGFDVIARLGRFGPYVSLGRSDEVEGKPKTVSLLRSMDLETVTFEEAMRLLSLPRTVGQHPGDNEDITVLNGRYGPYLRKGDETKKLESEDQLFTLSLEEALAMLSEKPSMNELGDDPVSGNRIVLKLGRYGPYVSDGEHNASLRKGDAAETMTTERAAELLQMRRERDSAKKQKKRKQKKQKKDGPGFYIPDLFD